MPNHASSIFYFASSNHLISPVLSLEALLIAGDNHSYSYYFHNLEGYIEIASGTPFAQSIYSLVPPQFLLDHAESQFKKISRSINLNFVQVYDPRSADISFYWDREIDLNDSSGVTLVLPYPIIRRAQKESGLKFFSMDPC